MFSVGGDAMVIMIFSFLFASLFVNDSTIPFVEIEHCIERSS